MPERAPVVGKVHFSELLARHNTRGGFRKRYARRLRHERHRAAGARIGLDHVNDLVLNRELYVQQTPYAKRERQARGDVAQLVHDGVR